MRLRQRLTGVLLAVALILSYLFVFTKGQFW
ncbi:hypothetical protein FB467_1779 [Ornithinicoccus hortensis]|uniref:Uncharacterized protein n=1 Tax=Ornithinicoccus hortensis TaxID=82346 RepID=A0A542YRD8_9MICO|nr:hypothetical protein FB467_1779 [Ornithinicoccus hortensis]